MTCGSMPTCLAMLIAGDLALSGLQTVLILATLAAAVGIVVCLIKVLKR